MNEFKVESALFREPIATVKSGSLSEGRVNFSLHQKDPRRAAF
jgi:hypothetical protein